MAVTRINNNQITDASAGNAYVGVNAAVKLQNYTITSQKIANNLNYGSDLTIAGNLTVNGTTTTVDTVNVLIKDPLITLADGQTSGTPTLDIGTIGLRGSENSAVLAWKESQLEFVTALSNTTVSNTTFNISSYANLHTGNFIAQGTTSLVGNLLGAVNATATITGGNLATAGTASATGTITGGNLLTGGQVSATGNVSGNYILGNGVSLTGVITSVANINNGTSNVTVVSSGGNVTVGVGGTGNVAVFATTGEYVTGVVSATGTITGGNLATGGTASATGNVTGGNVLTGGQVSATGNITGNYYFGNGSQLTGVTATTSGFPVTAGTSNIAAATNGNIGVTVGGTSNVAVFATTGEYVAGVVSASGTVTGGNLATGGTASATGNVTGGNIITAGNVNAPIIKNGSTGMYMDAGFPGYINFFNGNGDRVQIGDAGSISAVGNITGANILTGGLISSTGNITGGNVSGTNLTGTNVSVSGTATAASTVGGVITGTSTSVTGTQTAASTVGGVITGTSSSVTGTQTAASTVGGVITGSSASLSGNVTGGNVLTGGLISAAGNITANPSSFFIGNGSQLTGVTASTSGFPVAAGTSNISAATNSNIAVTVGGTSNVAVFATTGEYVAGVVSASGTVTGGNLATGGTASATGTITGGNLATGGTASASGNITGGNVLTGGQVSATGNVTGGNLVSAKVYNASAMTIITGSGNINLDPAGNVVLAGDYINGVLDPVQAQDAATKAYVDNMATTGIAFHANVLAATTTTLEIATGGSITYAQPNGAGNGVGATLTVSGGTFNLIDTSNVQTVGTRILVKNQANAVQNGSYVWSNATVLTRSTDGDTYGPDSSTDLSVNDYFFVSAGNVNVGTSWIVNAPTGTITFGTSNISFAQFSSIQTYTANTSAGLSLTGTVFSAKVDNDTTAFDGGGNISVKAGANLTTPNIGAATGTSLSVTGAVTAASTVGGVITGSSASVTGALNGASASVSGGVTAASVAGGVITGTSTSVSGSQTAASTVGGVITGSSASVTGTQTAASTVGGVITGTSLSASGNVTGGNLNATTGVRAVTGYFTGNVDVLGNLNATIGVVYANSGIFYGNAVTGNNAAFAGVPGFTPLGSNVVMQFAGNANSYSQLNFENINNGSEASTDFIATASNGNDSTNFIDLGIGSGTYAPVAYPAYGVNDGYVLNNGGNLLLNPQTAGKVIKLIVGGSANSNIVATVASTGITVTGLVSATGTVTGGNLATGGTISATGNITANPSSFFIGNGSQLTGVAASSAGFPISAGTTNISAATNGNIGMTIGGTSNVVTVATTGQFVTGLISATGNITGGNANIIATTASTSKTTGALTVGGGVGVAGDIYAGNSVVVDGGAYGNVTTTQFASVFGSGGGPNPYSVMQVRSSDGASGLGMQAFTGSGTLYGNTAITFALATIRDKDVPSNLVTKAYIDSTGLTVTGIANISGNITGGNVLTGGIVSATGNVSGNYILGNGSFLTGVITSVANINNGTSNVTVVSSGGNVTVGIGGTGNVAVFATTGEYVTGLISATGTITGGNLATGGTASATGNITGGNINTTGTLIGGNIVISGDNITDTNGRVNFNTAGADVDFAVNADTVANAFYVDAGTGTASFGSAAQTTNAIVAFNATTSILAPVGNTLQRPGTGVTGMLRFNSTLNSLEIYNNSQWTTVGGTVFTVIADQQFAGDDTTVAFTLNSTQTTNSCIVSINGVVQIPTIAYSVAGTDPSCVLTFTEAPAAGDIIDVRQITTTTTVTSISNGSGNAVVSVSDTSATTTITGDLSVTGNVTLSGNVATNQINNGSTAVQIPTPNGNVNFDINGVDNVYTFGQTGMVLAGNITPTANITYNLGTATNRWKDLYLSNSTIYLGNSQISANATSLIFTNPSGGQTVLTGASPSITGSSVSVTGTVTAASVVGGVITGSSLSVTGTINGTTLTGTSLTVSTGNITGGNLILSGAIEDSGQLDIRTTASNGNIVLTPNGTGNVNTGANISVTGRVTAASVVGGVITGSSTSVTGAQTAASTVGGVITGSSSSVTGAQTAASTVGGVITGTSVSVSGNVTGANLTTAGTATIGGFTISGNTIVSSGSTLTIDPNASGGVDGLVVISGNLQVTGNTTTINSNVVSTNDLTINFANNAVNSSAANGAGIEAGPIGSPYLTFLYNNTSNVWTSSGGLSAVGTVTAASTVGGVITGTSASVTGAVTGASLVGTITTASQTNITSVGTLGSLSVTGNVQGGNLRTAGLVSATGSITGASVVGGVMTGTSLSVSGGVTGSSFSGAGTGLTGTASSLSIGGSAGSATTAGTVTTAAQPNITSVGSSLTTSGALTVNSSNGVTAIINGGTTGVGNIGSSTTTFNTVFAKATTAQYADLAEKYVADAEYAPGTVLVFGGTHEVTVNAEDSDRRVAGVVSTDPGFLMNEGLATEFTASVALTGRVPCFVIGPVRKGDLMVAAGLGRARSEVDPKVGTVIGKALEDFDGAEGTIEVVVGRF